MVDDRITRPFGRPKVVQPCVACPAGTTGLPLKNVGDTARGRWGWTRFWSRSDEPPHIRTRSGLVGRPDHTTRDHEGGQQHHAPNQGGDHDRA